MSDLYFYGTGRRKSAIARVWLKPGEGKMIVNKRDLDEYFGGDVLRMLIKHPLKITNNLGKFDVVVTVKGGGISGQAGAITHGISRALLQLDESLRSKLRKASLLTRDSRIKERKKYGQKGARKKFQFSKR